MTDAPNRLPGPKPRRRWLQFRLRTALVVTAAIALGLGMQMKGAREQKELVDALDRLGVFYDRSQTKAPKWLRAILGDEHFSRVTAIHLGGRTDPKGEGITLSGKPWHTAQSRIGQDGRRWFEMGDQELEQIARLPATYRVKSVFLALTKVTDAGLEHLRHLSHLEWLDVSFTEVTEAGVERLREALPQCTIVHRKQGGRE